MRTRFQCKVEYGGRRAGGGGVNQPLATTDGFKHRVLCYTFCETPVEANGRCSYCMMAAGRWKGGVSVCSRMICTRYARAAVSAVRRRRSVCCRRRSRECVRVVFSPRVCLLMLMYMEGGRCLRNNLGGVFVRVFQAIVIIAVDATRTQCAAAF